MNTESKKLLPSYRLNPYLYSSAITDPRWTAKWYSDTDVRSLLEFEASSNFLIPSSISDDSKQFLEILENFSESIAKTAVLIPILINLKVPEFLIPCHWVSLVIKKTKHYFNALFADSLGNPIDFFLPIITQILKDKNIDIVFDSQTLQQQNEYDCGPCTVLNLLSMALVDGVSNGISTDIIEKQRQKLSEIKEKMEFSTEQDLFDIAIENLNKIPVINTNWNSITKQKKEQDKTPDLDGLNSIPFKNETEKVLKETNFKKDLGKIFDLFLILQDVEDGQLDLINSLIEIGELVGGENKIFYNDQDEECIRNKYGFINRALESKINSNGIYFERLYHLKLLLESKENISHHKSVDFLIDFFDKSKELKNDLRRLKMKVWVILTENQGLLKEKYKLVKDKCSFTEEMNSANFMDTLVTLSSIHYRRVLLSRVKSEATNIEQVDFNNREDRYYVSRVLIIIGELIREYLENNETVKEETRNVFLHFKHVRNILIHNHSIVVEGMDDEEDVKNFNESTVNVMNHLKDLIVKGNIKEIFDYKILNKSILFIKSLFNKYKHRIHSKPSEQPSTSSHRILSECLLQASELFTINPIQINKKLKKLNRKYQQHLKLIKDRKDYPSSLDSINKEVIMNYRQRTSFQANQGFDLDLSSNDRNEIMEMSNTEGRDKKLEKRIMGNIINYIIQASKILNETPLQETKLFELNKTYKNQFKLISKKSEEYPKSLDITNKEAIEKFIQMLQERKLKDLITSKDRQNKEAKDDLVTVENKMNSLIEKLIRETEYILFLETRQDLNSKKLSYMIEHAVGGIGQLMRDITEFESMSQKIETTVVHDSARDSAKSVRNQGLVHDVFSFSIPWFQKEIQDNILPAQHHFNAILTISRKNKCKISTITLFSIAISFMNIGFLDKAEKYFKKTIEYNEKHPEEVSELKDRNLQIFKKLWNIPEANIFEDLLGMNPYSFISRFYVSLTQIIACKFEDAFEELMIMKNAIQLERVMKSSNKAMIKLVDTIFKKLTYCLSVKNKFPEVINLMKEIIPLSGNQYFKFLLANVYRYEKKSEEAYVLFQEILGLDFKPMEKYKIYQHYIRLLAYRPNKKDAIEESLRYIRKMEALFIDNIGYFKRKCNDEFLLIQTLPLRLYTQVLIEKAELFEMNEEIFEVILEELEENIIKFHRIFAMITNDLKNTVKVTGYYYQFCRVYTSVIAETNANVTKENRKLESAQYFFDKAKERMNYFKEKGKLCLSSTNEMIKTANYLAYGYVKVAVRSDQDLDSYICKAFPYLRMVKTYMYGYKL